MRDGADKSAQPTPWGWRWLAMLATVAALTWLALRGLPDGRLHLYFLDVGQGDAILIEAPDGRQVLVDGGPSPVALLGEIGAILPFWDHQLDLVVLTHPDEDHATGLIELLSRYRVGAVMATGDATNDSSASGIGWRAVVEETNAPRILAARGAEIRLGELRLRVLNPAVDAEAGTVQDDNNHSVVLRLDYGETCALLTGDAEELVEHELMNDGVITRCELLKVSHHGSNGATSAPFLEAVHPSISVIQVGADNRYGHPHPALIERLQAVSTVLRTDLHGRVEAISDGQTWRFRTERPVTIP